MTVTWGSCAGNGAERFERKESKPHKRPGSFPQAPSRLPRARAVGMWLLLGCPAAVCVRMLAVPWRSQLGWISLEVGHLCCWGRSRGGKRQTYSVGLEKSHRASSRLKNNRISEGNSLPLLHTASHEMQLLRSTSELLGFLSAEFPLILNKLGRPSAVSSSIVAAWYCGAIPSPSAAAHTHVSSPPAIPQDQRGLWQRHVQKPTFGAGRQISPHSLFQRVK